MSGTSFGRQLSTSGSFSGALNLLAGSPAETANFVAALEPRRTVLWAFQDGDPIWNGIVWDQPHQSALDGTLPISCQSLDSLFSRRLIDENVIATNVDVFDVFRGLLTFAVSFASAGVANLQTPAVESGTIGTVHWDGADEQDVVTAWNNLAATCNFEWAFRPAVSDAGTYVTVLDLGFPELGLSQAESNLVFQMPGNLVDYAYPRTGSSSANQYIASAQDSSGTTTVNIYSQYPHGVDVADLALGYPLLQISGSLSSTTTPTQAQVNTYADGMLATVAGTQLLPQLTVQSLPLSSVPLGSWATLLASSPLHPVRPDGSPGLQVQGRITGWTVTPASAGQSDQIQLQMWCPESSQGGA